MTVADPVDVSDLTETVLRYAALLAGNREDAEDLVQEATARFLEEQASGRRIDYPGAYLRRIVTTVFLNSRRRSSLWCRTAPRLVTDDPADLGHAEQVAERARLGRALRRLPSRQRAAVVLRFYEDLAYADIATVLGCPDTTARSLVNRGLRALRLTIEGDD